MDPRPLPDSLGSKRIGAVVALTLAGALVGATSNTAPDDRFMAEVVIAIQPDADPRLDEAAFRRLRWEVVADVTHLPAVIRRAASTARDVGSPEDVRRRVEVRGVPGGSVLRIRARGRSIATARTLADEIAGQTVAFLKNVNRRNLVRFTRTQTFSFERGVEGWGAGRVGFSFPPMRTVSDSTQARVGSASLRADCKVQPGCGPSGRVRGEYLPGETYSARAFVRASSPGVRVQLVLGSGPKDVATGPRLRLSESWTATAVRFAPTTTARDLELSVQKLSRGAASIFVDGVTVTEDQRAGSGAVRLAARRTAVERAAAEDRYSIVSGATPVGESRPRTALWTLLGALAGFLAACSGLAAAKFARRRRHDAE